MEGTDEPESAHSRQRQVEQHQIDVRVGGCGGQALIRIGRGYDVDVVAEGFECGGDPFLHQRMVIDDEYFEGHCLD